MNNPVVKKIAAIAVGILVFAGLVYGYFSIFGTRAADFEPRDVIVSDIEKNTVRAGWTTGVDSQGVVEYGTTPTSLNFFAPEVAKSKVHSLDLTLLSPNTTYYFDVRVGDKKYDNGGVPWTFTTKGAEASVITPSTTQSQASGSAQTKPTPMQRLVISDGTNCSETDCAKIKLKLGKGCSTQDYFKCIRKPTGKL
jgi:hypothetical protein